MSMFRRMKADPSLPHVEDKIEARREALARFCHAQHQIATEQAIAPVRGLVGKIELRGEHRPLRSLQLDVIVTGAAGIERGHDGAEAIAALAIGKEVAAIAEAGIVVFAALIGVPEIDERS